MDSNWKFLLKTTLLLAAVLTVTVQGVPVQRPDLDLQSEIIETTVKSAAVLFGQLEDEFCSYMNSTISKLINEGKLVIPEFDDSELAQDIFIFISVTDSPANFSEILPTQGDSALVISPLNHQLLENLLLETITYNCHSNALVVTSQPYGTQTVLPRVMELHNMRFILSTGVEQETLVEFSGDWIVGSFNVNIEFDLSFENDGIMVAGDINSNNDFDLNQLAQDLIGVQLPPIVSGTFQHVRVEVNSNTGIAVVSTEFGGGSKAYLIVYIQRNEVSTSGFKINGAIAVEISSIEFSNLIQQLFSEDITGIPYFNSLTLPAVSFIVANDTITSELVRRAFNECPLLSNSDGEIVEGTTIYLQTEFTSSALQLIYNEGVLTFRELAQDLLSLRNLLSVLPGVNLENIVLPSGVSNILDLTISTFEIDVNMNILTVEVNLPMILTYFDDVFSIMDTVAFISLDFMDNTLSVAVDGELTIAGVTLDVAVYPDDMQQYVLQANAEQLHITNIIRQFGANFLPPELASISSNIPFLDFVIMNPQVTYPLSSSPPQVHISGQPIIAGYNIGPTAFTIIKKNNDITLVQVFELQSLNLADLLGSISPSLSTLLHGIVFLDQDINTAIIISPDSLPDVTLSPIEFQDLVIKKGFSLKAIIPIPSSCSSDPFCAVFQFLLGEDFELTLQGSIVNPSFYSLMQK